MSYDVTDLSLSAQGLERILWAERDMPVLGTIRKLFEEKRPLEGIRIGACLHVTAETASLMRTLKAGGAEVALCAAGAGSTQDDTAAALVECGIDVFAKKGEDTATSLAHADKVIDTLPQIVMDDGGMLVRRIHEQRTEALETALAGTEETITGMVKLATMARQGQLKFPIIAVNESRLKHLFDNRYGTGQSVLDGIVRATNRLIAGRTVVVSGYGKCGSSLAAKARGLGAQVIVCEINPMKALEAHMEGYLVMPAAEAAKKCDIWITATGDINAVDAAMFENLKDGALLANAGHFNTEINIPWLEENAVSHETLRPLVEEYVLPDGRRCALLAQGQSVNLGCGEGHPASVMDINFANQALAVEYLVKHSAELTPNCYDTPGEVETTIARYKLATLGVSIDSLTQDQEDYLKSWESYGA